MNKKAHHEMGLIAGIIALGSFIVGYVRKYYKARKKF